MHAPTLRLHPFEQVRPLAWIREVVAIRITVMLVEVIAYGNGKGALGIGITFELNPDRPAHNAARAFRADDKARRDAFFLAPLVRDDRGYAVGILCKALESRSHADFAPG